MFARISLSLWEREGDEKGLRAVVCELHLMHCHTAAFTLHSLKQEYRRDRQHAQKCQQAKIVDIRHQHRLFYQRAINCSVGLYRWSTGNAGRRCCSCQLLHPLLKSRVIRRQVRNHCCLVRLGAAREHGGNGCDSQAATSVSHKVKNAGSISNLIVSQRSHRHGCQWHKHKTHGEAADHPWPHNTTRRNLEIDVTKQISGESEYAEAEQ